MNIFDRCTHAFAVPGEAYLIDFIHPDTGLSLIEGETLAEVQARAPRAVVVLIAEHRAARAAAQDRPITWAETTRERYDEMLCVLPPAAQVGGAFLVGEPHDHHAVTGRPRFDAFLSRAGRFYVSARPITRQEFAASLKSSTP